MSSREAARVLGVKLETLYAYKSRGLLQSVALEGTRARRFLRADVERLKQRHDARAGHTAVAANALRWGEPVLDTSITRIDAAGPHYRGHAAVELAKAGVPFELVVELLWTGMLPASPPSFDAPHARFPVARTRALLGEKVPALGGISVVAAVLATRAANHVWAPREAEIVRAQQLVRRLFVAISLSTDTDRWATALRAPTVAHAAAAAWGLRTNSRALAALNAALVLCADHELNPSSFAARLAASTGAELHACVTAALAVISGPLHGGQTSLVEAFLAEVPSPAHARDVVRRMAASGASIPGSGHTLYPDGDPRGAALIEMAVALRDSSKVRRLEALGRAMFEEGYGHPTLDFGLVAVAAALGLPSGAATAIFALGRTAGWIAHIFEQRDAGYVLRPRARYVGPSGDQASSPTDRDRP
jgi:citrate synthase